MRRFFRRKTCVRGGWVLQPTDHRQDERWPHQSFSLGLQSATQNCMIPLRSRRRRGSGARGFLWLINRFPSLGGLRKWSSSLIGGRKAVLLPFINITVIYSERPTNSHSFSLSGHLLKRGSYISSRFLQLMSHSKRNYRKMAQENGEINNIRAPK